MPIIGDGEMNLTTMLAHAQAKRAVGLQCIHSVGHQVGDHLQHLPGMNFDCRLASEALHEMDLFRGDLALMPQLLSKWPALWFRGVVR